MAKKKETAKQAVQEITPLSSVKTAEKVETAQEMAERLQKDLDEYKKFIETVDSQEKLDELEKEMMTEMDKNDAHLKEARYALPDSCVFEGMKYSRADVAGKIIYFVSKIEQSWQYVLGLYELCKLWKTTDLKEINFGALDSTLRLLDQCKFQGMTEWRDILVINEYMKSLHEAFAKDTTTTIWLSQKHNEIIKRRDLIDPVKSKADKKD